MPHARSAQVTQAAVILADAFREEPFFAKAFPDPVRRLSALPIVFAALGRHAERTGWIDLVERDGRPVGAALWLDGPRADIGWREIVRDGHLRLGLAAGLWDSLRLQRLQDVDSAARRRSLPGPHLYLAAVGVRADAQRRGVGRELLTRGLSTVDARGLPAFLETNHEHTAQLYESVGFERVGEHRDGALHTRFMVRR